MNLAHRYVRELGMTLEQARQEWEGMCIDFAGDCSETIPGARMPYFDNLSRHWYWKYHCSVEVDGIIHDLWQDKPMPILQFMRVIGAETVEYPAEEVEV